MSETIKDCEQWKTIDNHRGYQVSRDGIIRNKKNGRILTNTNTGKGYLKVNLSCNGKTITERVHRLVAFAFLGKPPKEKDICHHINHNKSDNRVENLQWVTPKQNSDAHVEWHGKKYRVHVDNDPSAVELLQNVIETLRKIESFCIN